MLIYKFMGQKQKIPAKYLRPVHIPDTPENVAKAIMKGPPKKKWRFTRGRARPDSN